MRSYMLQLSSIRGFRRKSKTHHRAQTGGCVCVCACAKGQTNGQSYVWIMCVSMAFAFGAFHLGVWTRILMRPNGSRKCGRRTSHLKSTHTENIDFLQPTSREEEKSDGCRFYAAWNDCVRYGRCVCVENAPYINKMRTQASNNS